MKKPYFLQSQQASTVFIHFVCSCSQLFCVTLRMLEGISILSCLFLLALPCRNNWLKQRVRLNNDKNCTFLDNNNIIIGNNVMIAPDVKIYTATHWCIDRRRLYNPSGCVPYLNGIFLLSIKYFILPRNIPTFGIVLRK